ncbi:MAG TPA: hypothetical protein VJ951_00590 [Bacteroidales bacterium]|nr:hypothetical protein [Bacteroidales bacterium]
MVFLIAMLLFSLPLYSQEGENMVKYTPEFEFQDGIYPNFSSVKRNDPIPKTRLVTEADLFSREFYKDVTKEKSIVFYDDNGVMQELKTANIWGYGRNGVLFINLGGRFHRISFMGSIGHFVATLTTYNSGYYDPYYYPRNNVNRYYRNPSSSYSSTEVRQYLIDFETGKLHEFDVNSVEILLMNDPELHDEYMSLRRRKKRQYKFVYIRKFNERNPLYFPEK